MEPINTQKEYQEYVDKKSPNSPIWKNCLNAFLVGGLICTIGQFIMEICKFRGLSQDISSTIVSILLIFLILGIKFQIYFYFFLKRVTLAITKFYSLR